MINGAGQVTLRESREVKKVNGKPVTGDSVGGGILTVGAFSDGMALVSLSQQACMDYSLQPIDAGQPMLVEFASVAAGKRPADCRMQEDVSGRAVTRRRCRLSRCSFMRLIT